MNFYTWWWKGKGGIPNLGDALNPYLINKLGDNVRIKYVDANPYKECLIFVLSALKHFKKPNIEKVRKLFRFNNYTLCIGSILQNCNGQTVWGSGFMNANDILLKGKFLAVRGYKTQQRLIELGFQAPTIVGDPALLLPLIYTPHISKKYNYCIIPHISEYDFFIRKETKCPIINLQTDEIEKTIDQIYACKMVFSTSLHGIIIAHAYNIPAIWIKEGNIGTDGFKFEDYFSSVGIPSHQAFNKNIIKSPYSSIIEKYKKYIQPEYSRIQDIQRNLLSCSPFPLKKEIKSKFE